jgi:hypothetical protein
MAVLVVQVAEPHGTQVVQVAQELQLKVMMVQHHHLLRVEVAAQVVLALLAQQVQLMAEQVDLV